MLLLAANDPWLAPVRAACEAARARSPIAIAPGTYRGLWGFGAIGDGDALDATVDPAIDQASLARDLEARGIDTRSAGLIPLAIAYREDAIDATAERGLGPPAWPSHARPPTVFEYGALVDVIGPELAASLPVDRVEIDRAPLEGAALNHCELGGDGIARIRLLATNGTTVAGRTHALVHELGHALIGVARACGRSYACGYGQPDYGRFFARESFASPCDEEALVRAMADAWLLRRKGVTWSRTWPGAVDDVARDLDAGDLAAFARFRLAQGLGLAATPVAPRRIATG